MTRSTFRAALTVAATVVALAPAVAEPANAQAPANLPLVTALDQVYGEFHARPQDTTEPAASPAIGDITGDGVPELVVGGMDGHVIAYRSDTGAVVLDFDTGDGAIQASPNLIDLDGNGVLDVLAANVQHPISHLWGFRGNGQVVFHATEAPPISGISTHGFYATPVVGDIDGDGAREVVAASWDHRIYAWRLDNGAPKPGFPRFLFDTLWSSPVLADIDADGAQEIVMGGDMYIEPGAPYPYGGMLWVLRGNASDYPGYPKNVPGEAIWSTPAVVDLDVDGDLDIVFGTGHFFAAYFANPQHGPSRVIHAIEARTGNILPGWPRSMPGTTGASPAIGDLTGDGRPEVAMISQGGWVEAYAANGARLWQACARGGWAPCDGSAPVHGSPAIADVDNDGRQDVVVGLEGRLLVIDGPSGSVKYQAPFVVPSGKSSYAPATTPTIASVNGQTWIAHNVLVEWTNPAVRGAGDLRRLYVWRTGTPLGRADWPTFKQSPARNGTLVDSTPPTVVLTPALAPSQSSTRLLVGWWGTDAGSRIARFEVQVSENGAPFVTWVSSPPLSSTGGDASGSANFDGIRGRTYRFRARAIDRAGNVSGWTSEAVTTVAAGATQVAPYQRAVAVAANGQLSFMASPPVAGPAFGGDLVRGLAMRADASGYVLDAWGGIHPIGGAPALASSGYWAGQNVARGIALNPDGTSGYVVDWWGGLHPLGGAARVSNGAYFPGRDVVRGVVLLPSSTAAQPAGYVLDSWGGVHAFGAAPRIRDSAYWQGWDIARGIAVNPNGPGGWVLEGWGGVHPFGGAPAVQVGGYWHGWDIARGITMFRDPGGALRGYTVSGWGSIHPLNGAPVVPATTWWPNSDSARAIGVSPV